MQSQEKPLFADDLTEELLFLEEDSRNDGELKAQDSKWKILIVDDEEEIHQVTRLALNKFSFLDKSLHIVSAYSGAEARKALEKEPNFSVVFLDVVMETDDAGLQVVNFIRNDLCNRQIRIILRTGQPGVAPEAQIITKYDIDDYKAKTELTVQKLHTCLVASLRTYNEIIRIETIVQQRTAELAQKNRDIMDSILYAKRIQTAILPSIQYINQFIPEFFVFFKPKDILSGDFYWFSQQGNTSIVAIVDCTGHGVPGAIMSVIGYNLLNHIINYQKVIDPAAILEELDHRLFEVLQNERFDESIMDGMDISIMVIDHKKSKLTFSGANRPLYMFRNGELKEYAGSRSTIGDSLFKVKNFENQEITLKPADRFYLFTDGYIDQFGGKYGRKYTSKRLKEFLHTLQNQPMSQQYQALVSEFETWRDANSQTDDICFLGLEIQ